MAGSDPRSNSTTASAAWPATAVGGAGPGPTGPDVLSLEPLRNSVAPDVVVLPSAIELVKCRCRCWFCAACCLGLGIGLRQRLMPVVETFGGLLLATLTVDPELFPDPRAAHLYMLKRRCIGRLVRALWRAGHLHSRRYFCVMEWQRCTHQTHFHLLLDSSLVPHDVLLAVWSRNRPASAGPVVGRRPAFGTVFISRPTFSGGPRHAARYVTKYLIKVPDGGFPDWVLQMGRDKRIRRYSTSQGFWGTSQPRPLKLVPARRRRRTTHTYADRIAACGTTTTVLDVAEAVDRATGELHTTRRYVGRLDLAGDLLSQLEGGEMVRPGRCRFAGEARHAVLAAASRAAGRPVGFIDARASRRTL